MKPRMIILIFSAILSLISISLIFYWFGWKPLLCLFLFEWGRNSYKKYMKMKEAEEDEIFGEMIKDIFKK